MPQLRPKCGLIAIFGVALLAAAVASCIPDDPYQRFKLVEGTIYDNIRWAYERIHFDPRPIDVAIIGPSREQLGLSAGRIERQLLRLGKPANVANFSVYEPGRNVEWAIVDELYTTKSPKVIVIGVEETPNRWGHPAFKYIAPARSIVFPPDPLVHNYLVDLAYLPYRQMELFFVSTLHQLLHIGIMFNPVTYARTRTDFTLSHRMEDGKWIEMEREMPREALLAQARHTAQTRKTSHLPLALARFTDVDDRVYVGGIARAAKAHGTHLLFVFIPVFNGSSLVKDRAFYQQFGRIQDNGDLSQRANLYQGWAHLNHAGAMIASDRVANSIAPDL